MIEIIGHIAGVLIILSMLPQLYKTWKTKDVLGLSLVRYVLYTISLVLWIIYSFAIHSMPMIMTNITALVLVLPLLYMIIKWRKNNSHEELTFTRIENVEDRQIE